MIEVIREHTVKPFSYDGADCCSFVSECVKSLTGKDLNFRYRTEQEANALISKYGDLIGAISSRLGRPTEQSIRDGFVVVIKSGGRYCAGIVHAGRILVKNQRSIIDVSLRRAIKAWDPCHKQ